ncbi:glycosyltransferase [Sphingobacterium bovisgrunnientis]|uniref:glycosyltransferase n=1 Tax=Sphingobacterium bovisgrunnientis TaxID=1874697 RepID=UPI00135AAF1E|nr:glycosyltransferase [Sphingobacterium bovisgrunnientis]
MIKVVHIIPNLSTGGAERFVVDLINEGVCNDWDCELILFEKNNNFFINELNKKVKIHFLEKKRGFDLGLFYKLFLLIKKIDPNIVQSHLSAFNYMGMALIFCSCKFFHTIHSLPSKEYKSTLGKYLRLIFFKFLNKCTPISISPKVDKEARGLYGQSVKMIFNGRSAPESTLESIKLAKYFDNLRSQGYKIFLNIGSLKEAKNHFNLINAVKELNTLKHNKIKLIILGGEKGSIEYNQLYSLVDNNIDLLGSVNNPQDYLAQTDFFILPSLWEGMPISLIESFALGKVSLGTNVGGISYMIKNGVNGYLINGTSVMDIKAAIEKALILDPDTLKVISVNARNEYDQKYSINICYNAHNKIYQDV